jgi:hypothetical protein
MSEEVRRIAEQIRVSWEGPAWHGPSLRELLDGVTEEVAARKPESGGHSIREIVQHIASWQNAALRAMDGAPMPDGDWSDDWPETGAPWGSLCEDLRSATERLAERVVRMTPEGMNSIVAGRDYDFWFLLHGIPQHNAYHGGQIALLRKSK